MYKTIVSERFCAAVVPYMTAAIGSLLIPVRQQNANSIVHQRSANMIRQALTLFSRSPRQVEQTAVIFRLSPFFRIATGCVQWLHCSACDRPRSRRY